MRYSPDEMYPMKRLTLPLVATILASTLVILQIPLWGLFVWQRLNYPFPIDYGEGPLLRQLQYLQQTASLASLYAPLESTPYMVVNYPPVYLLTSHLFTIIGDNLWAGRFVSALAGLIAGIAIYALSRPTSATPLQHIVSAVIAGTWLVIPIAREWSGVMRVDMLGVALGLIGLVVSLRGRLTLGAILVTLALFTKPSLIAAPMALLVLWLSQPRQPVMRAIGAAVVTAIIIAGSITITGGNLWLHVVQSNINSWERALAEGFWREAWQLHAPLMLAALGLALSHLRHWRTLLSPDHVHTSMAVVYIIGGVIVGIGIGKVGAYANYFLELYAGMLWLIALSATRIVNHPTRLRWLGITLVAVCSLSVARYIPLWSETYAKPYGMIERQRPVRLAFGNYTVWHDIRREAQVLEANAVTASDLNTRITQLGATTIFTDVPGIAAQANVSAPMQVFEHRQLADVGLWDQRPMLIKLANGTIPVVVLDYLGNWMTPESIALITTRYAQSGSRGSYDIYQPIAVGAPVTVNQSFGDVTLVSVALPPPLLRPAYEPSTQLPVLLTWQSQSANDTTPRTVTLTLVDAEQQVLSRSVQPLFAGALTTADAVTPLQHLQALALPARLPNGTYQIAVQLDDDDQPAHSATTIVVQRGAGQVRGDPGYLVPDQFAQYIAAHGGSVAWGEPLMPAMPFVDMTLQCFTIRCLIADEAGIRPAPLGEWLRGATVLLPAADDVVSYDFMREIVVSGQFEGDAYALADVARRENDIHLWLHQEVLLQYIGDTVSLANGGERLLRLPGIPYRWGITP